MVHDFEDIVFVLDNRDEIEEELMNADEKVKTFLKNEFDKLLKNKSFEEALLGHVEPYGQSMRKDKITNILKYIC
jgi:hypothetical protein